MFRSIAPPSGSARNGKQLWSIVALVVLVMIGNGMVVPMMAIYARDFDVSAMLVGLMVSLFGVGRLVANLPAGVASERLGRKPLLCLGTAIVAVGAFGAALAEGFVPLLIWRFVQGVGAGVYMTVSATVLVQVSRSGERGRIMSLYQGGLLLGAGIGPGIGGLLVARWGYAAPFWAFGLAAVAALLVALLIFEEPSAEPPRTQAPGGGDHATGAPPSLRRLLFEPVFLCLSLVNFGVFFTRTASQWVAIPLIAVGAFDMTLEVIGAALTSIAVANFVVLPVVGATIDRIGPRTVTIWSTAGTAVAVAMIASAGHVGVFWAALVLMGIAAAFSGPAVAAALADRMPPGLQGPAMGVQRVVGDAGFVLGPLFFGLVQDATAFGAEGAMWASAVLMAAASALLALGARGAPRRKNIPDGRS